MASIFRWSVQQLLHLGLLPENLQVRKPCYYKAQKVAGNNSEAEKCAVSTRLLRFCAFKSLRVETKNSEETYPTKQTPGLE